MKLTQQKISAALKAHDLYFESYLNGDINNISTLLVENYIQIGSVEEEVFFNKKDALKFVFDTIDQVAGKLEMRNRKTTPELFDDFVLIFELCDLYVLIESEWFFYSRFRATSVLQEKPEGWKIIHQHSSLPDWKAQEGQNIAIDKISEENLQLRDAVKRRTIELENKTRELEIEAALERVRSTAMALQRSEDLKTVVGVLYDQLRNLGFQFGIASIIIMDHDTGDMDWWNEGFGDGYVLPECYHVPFFDHSGHLRQLELWKSRTSYAEIEISGQEKKTYDAYYFYRTDFSHAPEPTKQLMMQQESLLFSMAFMKYGALSWSPTPLSKDQATILERFAKVFEQCYTRFLDLQKAEAQAKEAQIEAALERVRSRSMGMHQGADLKGVVKELYDQLRSLGFQFGVASIIIMDADTGDLDWWMEGFEDGYDLPEKYHVPYFDHQGHRQQIEHWKNGSNYAVVEIAGLEKKAYDAYYFFQTDFAKAPENSKNLMMSQEAVVFSMAYMKYGSLSWSPFKLDEDKATVLQRMAKVFEQTYTRFLDLQKAEAQAREAQIEASLERVRSRSMAMHKSEELREVVSSIYEQLQKLGFTYGALALVIMQQPSGDSDWWMSGFGKDDYPEKYRIPFLNHPFYLAQLDAWNEGKDFAVHEVSGKSKKQYDHLIFSQTEFVRIPEDAMKIMTAFEKIIFSNMNIRNPASSQIKLGQYVTINW